MLPDNTCHSKTLPWRQRIQQRCPNWRKTAIIVYGCLALCLGVAVAVSMIMKFGFNTAAPISTTGHCDTILCSNAGTCLLISEMSIICLCTVGFTGPQCQTPVQNCQSTTFCANGGTCTFDGDFTATCLCPPGFTGTHCSLSDDSVLLSTLPSQDTYDRQALYYDDADYAAAYGPPTAFEISTNISVSGIRFRYGGTNDGWTTIHGGVGNVSIIVQLEPLEFFVYVRLVSGELADDVSTWVICEIEFFTSSGRDLGPYGDCGFMQTVLNIPVISLNSSRIYALGVASEQYILALNLTSF